MSHLSPPCLQIIRSTVSVDLININTVEILTLPQDFYITDATTICTVFSGDQGGGASISMGVIGPDYYDIAGSLSTGGFTAVGQSRGFFNFQGGILPANTPLTVNMSFPDTGPTTEEIQIFIIGFYSF